MSQRKNVRWITAAVLGLASLTAVYTGTVLADGKSDDARIDSRLTKDADDHLKNNLAKDEQRDVLRKEIVRAAAMEDMARTLAEDAKFRDAYKSLIDGNAKRKKDVMPSEQDVVKEKSSIINDQEAMTRVMARAIVLLDTKK